MGKIAENLEKIAGREVVTSLPAVSSSDNGKVLTVSGGEWTKQALPVELPAVSSSDNGKVLTVSGGIWTKQALPVELPAVTSSDAGKVLTVNAEGQWVAAALPSE